MVAVTISLTVCDWVPHAMAPTARLGMATCACMVGAPAQGPLGPIGPLMSWAILRTRQPLHPWAIMRTRKPLHP